MKRSIKSFSSAVLLLLTVMTTLAAGVPFPADSAAAGHDTETIIGNSVKAGKISIRISSAVLEDGRFMLEGETTIPSFFPYGGKGKSLVFNELYMDQDGSLHGSAEFTQKKLDVPALMDGYSLWLYDGKLIVDGDDVYFYFPSADFMLPYELEFASVKVEEVKYMLSGRQLDIDYGSIRLAEKAVVKVSGLPVAVDDIEFIPYSLSSGWTSYNLSITGSADFGDSESIPAIIRGKRVPVSVVLDDNGQLKSFEAGFKGVSGSLETSEFPLTAASLKDADLSVILAEGNVTLVVESGNLLLDGELPAWLYGRECSIKSIAYDFRTMSYTSVKAASEPFDINVQPEMKKAVVSIDYEGQKDGSASYIYVTGEMVDKISVSSEFTAADEKETTGTIIMSLAGVPQRMKIVQKM